MKEEDADPGHYARTKIPPIGSGAQARTGGTSAATAAEGTTTTGVPTPPVVTHLRFGTPKPPTLPIRNGGGKSTGNNSVELENRFSPLRHQGANSGDRVNEDLTSGIIKGGSTSATSSSRGSRGMDPIPLTPEILLLLDHLEPDKGKQARLLTEHLT